jgi:hypothetical protein
MCRLDRAGAFTDGRGDSLRGSAAHIPGGEHARKASLSLQWGPDQGPADRQSTGRGEVRSGEQEAGIVSSQVLWQPVGTWLRAGQDEERARFDVLGLAGYRVAEGELFQAPGATGTDYLGVRADSHVG